MQPSQWFGEQVIFLDKQQFKIKSDAKKQQQLKLNSQRLCKKKYGKRQRNKALCFSHLFSTKNISHVRNHCHLWTQATQPWLHLHRRRLKLQLLARFNHWWTCVSQTAFENLKREISAGERSYNCLRLETGNCQSECGQATTPERLIFFIYFLLLIRAFLGDFL